MVAGVSYAQPAVTFKFQVLRRQRFGLDFGAVTGEDVGEDFRGHARNKLKCVFRPFRHRKGDIILASIVHWTGDFQCTDTVIVLQPVERSAASY